MLLNKLIYYLYLNRFNFFFKKKNNLFNSNKIYRNVNIYTTIVECFHKKKFKIIKSTNVSYKNKILLIILKNKL